MDETLLGTIPAKPMTNVQKRAHKALAKAEKRLIVVLTYGIDEPDETAIEREEARVARALAAWKKACA